jgi:hypothetical protein
VLVAQQIYVIQEGRESQMAVGPVHGSLVIIASESLERKFKLLYISQLLSAEPLPNITISAFQSKYVIREGKRASKIADEYDA